MSGQDNDPEDPDDAKGVGAHLTWIVLGVVLVVVMVVAATTLLP